ncbi:MAG: hypothetical protein MUD17_08175 [Gemmatimonadaceae bacterium]|jgi:hypothetical protein|nr:hypothetical protein [Gemmatimonadaceae bacterium]
MGCLSRLVGAAVVVGGLATAAWWFTGGAVPLPEVVTSRLPFEARGRDSLSTAPSRAYTRARWQTVDSADSRRAAEQLAELARPGGPGMVTLQPGELVAFLIEPFAAQLPASARAAQVAVSEGRVYVKADVKLVDLGLDESIGAMIGSLDRRDTIVIGGVFEPITAGRGQFLVDEVVMGEFSVPSVLAPKLAAAIRRGTVPADVAPNGFPVALPSGVGDVRIRGDQVTVFRAAP